MTHGDPETRQRVLNAAAQLFADRGFKKVTVREICRAARANVASVNYHFRDKGGLYREVLQGAIDTMRATTEAARKAGEGLPADERLRRYIHVSLCRAAAEGSPSWIRRLITREIADPTPAFDAVVEQGVQPRIADLSALVGEMLDCAPTDDRVGRCVASIQAQWLFYLPTPVSSRLRPKFEIRPKDIDRLAEHIAEFSLAGIRAIAQLRDSSHKREPPRS